MNTILKRCCDLVGSALGLLALSPAFAFIALAIKLSDRGPVFYRQERVGRHGASFRIWKFRTMVTDADRLGPGVTQGGDRRVTRIGRLLRRAKLDELPQLINVFTGEMSFVGPRPEVPQYVAFYTPEQKEILRYKPGITDPASILFLDEEGLLRGVTDVEAFYLQHCVPMKIGLNLEYSRRANVLTDLGLIAQTVLMVLGVIPKPKSTPLVADVKAAPPSQRLLRKVSA